MRILYAVVCEHAEARENGRVDVHGIFHLLYAPGFPARQERMVLAIAVEWGPAERGSIAFGIDLLDASRSPVFSIKGETEVGDPGPLDGPPRTRLILPLPDVVFPAAGVYELELEALGVRLPLGPFHLIEARQD